MSEQLIERLQREKDKYVALKAKFKQYIEKFTQLEVRYRRTVSTFSGSRSPPPRSPLGPMDTSSVEHREGESVSPQGNGQSLVTTLFSLSSSSDAQGVQSTNTTTRESVRPPRPSQSQPTPPVPAEEQRRPLLRHNSDSTMSLHSTIKTSLFKRALSGFRRGSTASVSSTTSTASDATLSPPPPPTLSPSLSPTTGGVLIGEREMELERERLATSDDDINSRESVHSVKDVYADSRFLENLVQDAQTELSRLTLTHSTSTSGVSVRPSTVVRDEDEIAMLRRRLREIAPTTLDPQSHSPYR